MTDFFTLEPGEQARRLEAAARDALEQWDLEGAGLTLIKHRENAVFRVERDGAAIGALRLHRHGYHTDAALESEIRWMQALKDAGIDVPIVMPARSGELFVRYSGDGLPGEIQIDLFEWIEGEQLGSVEEGIADEASVAHIFGAVGELAARVHNQAVGWQPPPGFERHAWDADGLAGERPLWGRFWELGAASPKERGLLERGRDAVLRELGRLAKSAETYSMIHADCVPENVLVDGDRVRLIDFDDAGFGWHLFEIATSLYFIRGEPFYDRAEAAFIEGYRKHRPLADEHLELLPLFFMARGFTYLGWVHTRSETETARELTPMLLEMACELADDYLSR